MTIVIKESEIPGIYTAHYLEGDLVSQGDCPERALDALMICKALMDEHWANGQVKNRAPRCYWPRDPSGKNTNG